MKRIIILVGPKGSGKSYIGSLLQRQLDFCFIRVENIWLELKNKKKYKSEEEYFKDLSNFVSEAIAVVFQVVGDAFEDHNFVVIESLGLPPLFEQQNAVLRKIGSITTVKVEANLELCRERINSRDHTIHIAISDNKVNELNESVVKNKLINFDFSVNNEQMSDAQIVAVFKDYFKL